MLLGKFAGRFEKQIKLKKYYFSKLKRKYKTLIHTTCVTSEVNFLEI